MLGLGLLAHRTACDKTFDRLLQLRPRKETHNSIVGSLHPRVASQCTRVQLLQDPLGLSVSAEPDAALVTNQPISD